MISRISAESSMASTVLVFLPRAPALSGAALSDVVMDPSISGQNCPESGRLVLKAGNFILAGRQLTGVGTRSAIVEITVPTGVRQSHCFRKSRCIADAS